jgi:threonine/homoserine/homoserine lactone efflux protein
VTNPKAFVFLAAFFPQFVDHSQALLPQYSVLAVTSVAIDTGGDVELRVACPRTEAMAQLGGPNEAAGTVFWVIIRDRRKPVGALLSGEFTTPAREVG